jgi:hypothetical protein
LPLFLDIAKTGSKTKEPTMLRPQRSKLLQSLHAWKETARVRRAHVNALKKRLTELTQSRDAWKAKAQHRQQQIAELQAHNERLAALTAPHPEKKIVPGGTSIPSRPFNSWSP